MNFKEMNKIFEKYREDIFSDEKYYDEEKWFKLIIDIKSFIWTFSFYEKLLKENYPCEFMAQKIKIKSKKFDKNYWKNIRLFLKEDFEIESQNLLSKQLKDYVNLRNNLIHDCHFNLEEKDRKKISNFEKYNNFFKNVFSLIQKKIKSI